MFEGNPLQQRVLARFGQIIFTVGHMHLFPGTESSPCTTIHICQDAAIEAQDVIFLHTSLPRGGSQMGVVASVFEAITRRYPENTPDPWTKDINEQRRVVVATRHVLGLDWSYKADCNVHGHNQQRTIPDQTATYRDATIITIPEAQASSIGGKIKEEFFESPGASDLSIQGQTICPHCAADITITMCDWTLLPCTSGNASDRLFLRSVGVFTGNYGQFPTPSLSLTLGAEYSLVGISYHLPVGLSAERNHFTSQFRSRGRWIKYDCLD